MKLRILFFAALAAAFVLVGCEKENQGGGKAEKPVTTINNVTAGGTFNVLGTVVAAGNEAFILSDATGVLMVYMNNHNVAVGEQVLIEGPATQEYKNNALQIAPTKITKTGKTFTPEYSPKVLSGENVAAYIAGSTCVCEEVEIKGVVSFSDGKYINVTVPGTDAQGSIKYKSIEDMSAFEGKSVIIKGYITTTYNYLGVLPYSVEIDEEAEPFILSVDPASLNFTAEGGSLTVDVALSSSEGVELEVVSSTEAFVATYSNGEITVTASALAEGVSSVTGTITVNLKKGGSVIDTQEVKVYQASASEKFQVLDFTTVTETNTSFTGQTYGDVTLSGSSIALNKSGQLRVYANSGEFTLSVSDANITSIEITVDETNGDNLAAEGYADGKWTGSASSVKFTNGANQTRIKTIKVVYSAK